MTSTNKTPAQKLSFFAYRNERVAGHDGADSSGIGHGSATFYRRPERRRCSASPALASQATGKQKRARGFFRSLIFASLRRLERPPRGEFSFANWRLGQSIEWQEYVDSRRRSTVSNAQIAVFRKRRGEPSNRPEFDVCDFGVASPIARVRSPHFGSRSPPFARHPEVRPAVNGRRCRESRIGPI